MLRMEQSSLLDHWKTSRCRNFDRPKPEEAKIRRLFASMMDNMTGKETAVLIMIHPICMMIHISGYFTYPAMVRSRCSRISEGPLDMFFCWLHEGSSLNHTGPT